MKNKYVERLEALEEYIDSFGRSVDIAVDFDDTLFESSFPEIGQPNFLLIELMKKKRSQGHRVILWTCREDELQRSYLTEAVQMCKVYGLEFNDVNKNTAYAIRWGFTEKLIRKISADVYIDDKAFRLNLKECR